MLTLTIKGLAQTTSTEQSDALPQYIYSDPVEMIVVEVRCDDALKTSALLQQLFHTLGSEGETHIRGEFAV